MTGPCAHDILKVRHIVFGRIFGECCSCGETVERPIR